MINIIYQDKWNSFLFKLRDNKEKELLELAKISSYSTITINHTHVGEDVILKVIIGNRIIYKRFEEYIENYKTVLKEHFLYHEEIGFVIKDVVVDVFYERFVDWDSIRTLESKETLIQKINKEKDTLLNMVEGIYAISEEDYVESNIYLLNCFKLIGLDYPNKMKNFFEIENQYYEVARGAGSWGKRREYINELYQTTLEILHESLDDGNSFDVIYEKTGWPSIDEDVKIMLSNYEQSESLIEFKAISNMLRDLLIKISQLVYNSEIHYLSEYEGNISSTDYKRMLSAYIETEYPGRSNKEFRNFFNSTWDLISKLVHSESTEKQMLNIAVDATLMVIRTVKLLDENI